MKAFVRYIIISSLIVSMFSSCHTLERASVHGFNSGFYKFESGKKNTQNVYVDVTDEKIDVYDVSSKQPSKNAFLTIPSMPTDTVSFLPVTFKKGSLDMDITSILLKYRPSVYGLQSQLTTDLNMALYAGWRHDNYYLSSFRDPLGKSHHKNMNLGYDFGVFAGPGVTLINPLTTLNRVTEEYSGMIMQMGIAGFIESNMASFGLSLGFDTLLNPDRKIWIYNKKLWIGFVVGIALN